MSAPDVAPAAPPESAARSGPPPGAPPPKPPPATWKLVGVLAGGGAIAGLLLVVAYLLTIEPITAHKKQVLADGVREVLRLPPEARYDELWLRDGRLVRERPAGAEDADRVWVGRGPDGAATGWAILAEGNGFADAIRLIFGWDARSKRILALRVLGSKETPGLGDKINADAFAAGFRDREASAGAPLKGVKADSSPNAPNEVDTITGATVSSRAVIRIITAGLSRFGPAIEAYREEGTR